MDTLTAERSAGPAAPAAPPFAVRGVVEGFYGPPYTFPERDDLIAWMGRRGLNCYLYGPKNDRQHRNRWREPYPAAVLAQFAATARGAAAAGVTFAYALSPSVSICYSDPADFALVRAKLGALFDVGVRAFSLFFDDITPAFRHEADGRAFSSFAAAHADLSARTLAWLRGLDPACTLSVCPTDYYGPPPFSPYLRDLGRLLPPAVDLFYTGAAICAPTIGVAEARAFAEATGRPPLIWDNYPVNDLGMRPELHLGPLTGRDPALAQATRGLLLNPMLQAEASKVALATGAEFLSDPAGYRPEAAWLRALDEVAGPESMGHLLRFAEHTLRSDLGGENSALLGALAAGALAALRAGERFSASPAVARLRAHLDALDEASYHLKNRMANLALRANLLPWIELCDVWLDIGKRVALVLEALERGGTDGPALAQMAELLAEARAHNKRFGARVLEPLAVYAQEQAARR